MRRLLLFALLCAPAWGYNTWYVSTTGSNSNAGTSAGAAWATLPYAKAHMGRCDTLIVEPGYYYDSMIIDSSLAGNVSSSGCYTLVEAATPWTVTVDCSLVSPEPNGCMYITSTSYIQVVGIKAAADPNGTGNTGSGFVWYVIGSNHVKLQETAGYNAPCGWTNGYAWNIDVYAIGPASSYVLVEDSHAWGCGRYKFLAYQSDHVIFRRDVARHDFAGAGDGVHVSTQSAGFVNYDSQYDLFQNDIYLDSGDTAQDTGNIYGGLWSEHHWSDHDNDLILEGSIAENVYGQASFQDPKQSGTHILTNNVSVNSSSGIMVGSQWISITPTSVTFNGTTATFQISTNGELLNGNQIIPVGLNGSAAVLNNQTFTITAGSPPFTSFTIPYVSSPGGPYTISSGTIYFFYGLTYPGTAVTSNTIINETGYASSNANANGLGLFGTGNYYLPNSGGTAATYVSAYYTGFTDTYNIFQHIVSSSSPTYAIASFALTDYNMYYLNTANLGSVYYGYPAPVAGAHDVTGTNPGLLYVTRPGGAGNAYGATILHPIGATGTLWGDTGYDTLQSGSLWPWPYESTIKADMAAFSMTNPKTFTTISGARGFAASGSTLYGGPLTLTSYIWEALGNACPVCGTITNATISGATMQGATVQ